MPALRIRNTDPARAFIVRVWHRSNAFMSDGDSPWLDEAGTPSGARSRDHSVPPGATLALNVAAELAFTVLPAGDPVGIADAVRGYLRSGSTASGGTAGAVPLSLTNEATAPLRVRVFTSATFQFSPGRSSCSRPARPWSSRRGRKGSVSGWGERAEHEKRATPQALPEEAPSAMNREAYDRIAPEWDRARFAFYGREREYIDALLEGLPRRSAILDLGCGTGRPIAEYLLARGHRVTGVDQAAQLLAIARARFPEATWIESRLEDYAIPAGCAAIVCWDTLFHLERSVHARLLARMAMSLDSGGRIMLTVGGSEHPAFTDTMFGETFFYDSHLPSRVLVMLGELGFEPLIAEFMNPPTSGRDKGRYAIVAKLSDHCRDGTKRRALP